MSTKYRNAQDVPTEAIIDRLNELSTAVTKGRVGIDREFCMSIPAELDRDADLVLSIAADRLRQMGQRIESLEEYAHEVMINAWENT